MKNSLVSKFDHFMGSYIRGRYLFLFIPGLLLVLLGVSVPLFPALWLPIMAAFLVSLGLILVFAAWKVLQFKKKVDQTLKQFEGKVFIQTGSAPDLEFEEVERKIVLH